MNCEIDNEFSIDKEAYEQFLNWFYAIEIYNGKIYHYVEEDGKWFMKEGNEMDKDIIYEYINNGLYAAIEMFVNYIQKEKPANDSKTLEKAFNDSFSDICSLFLPKMNRETRRDKSGGNKYKRERKNERPQYWR